METVRVNLSERSYDILIDSGIFDRIPVYLGEMKLGNRYAIITDDVLAEHGSALLNNLERNGMQTKLKYFPQGEKSKSWDMAGSLAGWLSDEGFDRKSCLIALGGGVPGDLAGFVAYVFLRKISYVQVPTTLLAQVDSSIGGKTAVNLKGKNIAGGFHQPKAVFIDTNFLKSLPEEEITRGLSEVVKYGMISDRELFEYLEENVDRISRLEEEAVMKVVPRCVRVKAGVVSRDEEEANERAILNYGHTIGHAVEACSEFEGTHGDAVRIGMHYAGRLGTMLGIMKREAAQRQDALLRRLGPLELPRTIKPDELIRFLYKDKKAESGQLMFVFPEDVGVMANVNERYKFPVSEEDVRRALE